VNVYLDNYMVYNKLTNEHDCMAKRNTFNESVMTWIGINGGLQRDMLCNLFRSYC